MQQETVVTTIQNAKKVLFVLPMALGDFAYLHLVIREFCAMYPQIKADVLFDEAFHGNRFTAAAGYWSIRLSANGRKAWDCFGMYIRRCMPAAHWKTRLPVLAPSNTMR